MRYLPTIDEGACIGSGDCEEICPSVFRVVRDCATIVGEGEDELVLAAARECPTEAIIVTDTQTGVQVFPEN
jgi:ferredoxin